MPKKPASFTRNMPAKKARPKAAAATQPNSPVTPTRPVGPLVMVVTLYPTTTRVRDKKTGLYVTQRQHPLPSSNVYYRLKHSARVYSKSGNRFKNAAIVMDGNIKTATMAAVLRAYEEYDINGAPQLVAAFCIIKMYYPDSRRRDQHNTVFKAAFDAMTNMGVWKDDNRVELYIPLPSISRHNPRVEFHIYRLPEGETGVSPVEPTPPGWVNEIGLIDENENDTYL